MLLRSLSRAGRPRLIGLIALCLLISAVGCGGSGPCNVSGQVTFDGQPVEDGRITFRQVEGEKKVFSGPISKGAYAVKCDPGKMAVEIIASRIIPGKFDNSNGTPEPVGVMYIPAKYNSATKLTAEVSGSSKQVPFELTSK